MRGLLTSLTLGDDRTASELGGRAAHARRSAFESDRARDRALQAAGWRVVRVTWAQLHTAPDALERDLRTLLGAKRAETATKLMIAE